MEKAKIKVISRNPADYLRQTRHDIFKQPRNTDPKLHPFQAAREYTRALNAAKLERLFAKPFIHSLDGHADAICSLAKHPVSLSCIASGCCDGEIRIWNLSTRKCLSAVNAHRLHSDGLSFRQCCTEYSTGGDDKSIKIWSLDLATKNSLKEPDMTILSKNIFNAIDHSWKSDIFATCGQVVEIWDEEKTEPIRSFTWGIESHIGVRFNPIETNVLACTGSDRSIALYDVRASTPMRKVILEMKTNTVAWNPLEAYHFTAANEDGNLYTFDMRRLDSALCVHVDHVSAVLDVDYSPTGQEFVSGSFDKTVRIFPVNKGKSREVYHTRRMQRVFCVKWSMDNNFIVSGSDETNLRLWKADSSARLGALTARQKASNNYNKKLKKKFENHPQVKRILRHRHVPKPIHRAAAEKRVILDSQKRKEENRLRYTKPDKVERVPERKKHVVGEEA
ncbi:uncharacterized protein TRIADDRAFT_50515 [Trichoplax adhaerens]|uniref:DDB1- and CUL4-associated factor 13 n=1 Tax=Trichoplax adhaerens TaxID=10228 RepID=B3S158_TRIAD|nr:hypothetical protein TRIADDRAFT_50515 [Trichoplax adhaerens]EDV23507.1 hypothetical protein TRIADDRAFT_50515 [Trichoplax adhaerens]|eukprot:XP_002114417.1 hypothetical protein TRIADDRAFT_50515 [Trichoplax adhaerens]